MSYNAAAAQYYYQDALMKAMITGNQQLLQQLMASNPNMNPMTGGSSAQGRGGGAEHPVGLDLQ